MATKTDAEWREELTPEQYEVLRKGAPSAPSPASTGTTTTTACTAAPAAAPSCSSSDTKFDSGTGWPSFTEPAVAEAVELREDRSWGMIRTEVVCRTAAGTSATCSTTARATPAACATASTPARSTSTRADRPMATRVSSTRLIGRAAELAELEAALADAADGRPSIAFVAGESGVGKSRLLAELERARREGGALVLAGDCVDLGESELPYVPLVAALRPLARSGDPALTEPVRAAVAPLLPGSAPRRAAEAGEDDAPGAPVRGPALAARRASARSGRCCC